MPAEFEPEDSHDATPAQEPAVTNADRATDERLAADVKRYGDLSHLTAEQQQRARDQIDNFAMMNAAANTNPGGFPGERYTVEKSDPQPLGPDAITEVPKDL